MPRLKGWPGIASSDADRLAALMADLRERAERHGADAVHVASSGALVACRRGLVLARGATPDELLERLRNRQ